MTRLFPLDEGIWFYIVNWCSTDRNGEHVALKTLPIIVGDPSTMEVCKTTRRLVLSYRNLLGILNVLLPFPDSQKHCLPFVAIRGAQPICRSLEYPAILVWTRDSVCSTSCFWSTNPRRCRCRARPWTVHPRYLEVRCPCLVVDNPMSGDILKVVFPKKSTCLPTISDFGHPPTRDPSPRICLLLH